MLSKATSLQSLLDICARLSKPPEGHPALISPPLVLHVGRLIHAVHIRHAHACKIITDLSSSTHCANSIDNERQGPNKAGISIIGLSCCIIASGTCAWKPDQDIHLAWAILPYPCPYPARVALGVWPHPLDQYPNPCCCMTDPYCHIPESSKQELNHKIRPRPWGLPSTLVLPAGAYE